MQLHLLLPRAWAYRFALAQILNGALLVLAFVGSVSPDFAGLSALWPFPDTWRAYAVALHASIAAGIVGAKRFWAALKPTLPDRDADGTPDVLDEAPDDATLPRTPDGAA